MKYLQDDYKTSVGTLVRRRQLQGDWGAFSVDEAAAMGGRYARQGRHNQGFGGRGQWAHIRQGLSIKGPFTHYVIENLPISPPPSP